MKAFKLDGKYLKLYSLQIGDKETLKFNVWKALSRDTLKNSKKEYQD